MNPARLPVRLLKAWRAGDLPGRVADALGLVGPEPWRRLQALALVLDSEVWRAACEAAWPSPPPSPLALSKESAMPPPSSVTHVAGPAVEVGGRVVQRCALCGDKLCDSRGSMAPEQPDGTPPVFPTWRAGCLVQCAGNRQSDVGRFDGPEPLPADFCLALVE